MAMGEHGWIRRGVARGLMAIGFAALAVLAAETSSAQSLPPGFRVGHGTATAIMPAQMPLSTGPQLTSAELQEMREKMEALREAAERKYGRALPAVQNPAGNPAIAPVRIVSAAAPPISADSLLIGRNERNAIAATSGSLAEPAAINNRSRVFYAGNFHFESSKNHGVSYTAAAIPAGPPDAPDFCCDNDMAVDPATGIAIHIAVYGRAAGDNAPIVVFIRDPSDYGAIKCTFVFDTAGNADNEVDDFPKIGLSRNDVYISAAVNVTSGTKSSFSRMFRIDKAALIACGNPGFTFFDQDWTVEGQRVWRPAGGAEQSPVMMWAHSIDATHMRVFKWPESAGAPINFVRPVAATTFAAQSCKGGVGKFDYYEGAFPAGFTTSCAFATGVDQSFPVLACYNESAPMANRPQAFLRGTVFRASNSTLISEPDLFSNDICLGFPAMSANARGDIGFSLAGGGNVAGTGSAVQGLVGLTTPSGTEIATVAGGIANQASNRFGDYFTIHRYNGCTNFFGATAYAWDRAPVKDGRGINARWVEFGRYGDAPCWQSHQ